MSKTFKSMLIAAALLNPLFVGPSASPTELDTRIVELGLEMELWWDLQHADHSLSFSSTVEKIASEEFFSKLSDFNVRKLRRILASRGVPSGLTPAEIELFKRDPQNFNFVPLREIPFEGHFHGGKNFADRVEHNGMFFVIDFWRVYSRETKKKAYNQFRQYYKISRVNMGQAATLLSELYPNCAHLLKHEGTQLEDTQ